MTTGRYRLPGPHAVARKVRSAYMIQDHPETVVAAAKDYPEICNQLRYKLDFYERWVRALESSDAAKMNDRPIDGMKFPVKPYQHQLRAIRFILSMPACALFAEPGTGKTFCALKSIEWRTRNGRCSKTLVVAPASTLRASWYDDMRKFTDLKGRIISNDVMWWWQHPRTGKLYRSMKSAQASCKKKYNDPQPDSELLWNDVKDVRAQLKTDYEVMIMSPEIAMRYADDILEAGFDFVVMDESTMIKSHSSKTFKAIYEIGMRATYRLALTGTPITNTVEDIWSQMQFVDNSLDYTIGDFREKYMKPHPAIDFVWLNKPGCEEEVVERIKNRCMWIKKQDCLDLPDRMTLIRNVRPSGAGEKYTNQMMREGGIVFADGKNVVCDNPLTIAVKLRQIANGYVKLGIEDDGEIVEIDKHSPKLDELSLIASQHDKLIIWCVGTKEIDDVVKHLGGKSKVAVIDGRTRSVDAELSDFKNKKKFMVAHPASARFGLTMTWCNAAVFYSYNHNLESYLQARDRIYRIGQNRKVTEYILMCGKVEELIWKSLDKKMDFTKLVMEAFANDKDGE